MKSKFFYPLMMLNILFQPLCISSQTIILGYSDVFAIGNQQYEYPNIIGYSDLFLLGRQQYEYPNIIGYSGVFEMNNIGQYYMGYSGLFGLNTTHGIIGFISNAATGMPIQGAVVSTFNYTSLPSNSSGYYNLLVPYGYGYQLTIMAEGFETMHLNNINVIAGNQLTNINIQLTPVSIEPILETLHSTLCPEISEVQQGSTLHRYYQITNNISGNPLPLIPVSVTGNNFSQSYLTNDRGVVDISLNSDQIGNGQPGSQMSFSIVSVNNEPLAEPIVFTSVVTEPEYGKYWENYSFSKLGLTNFGAELKKGCNSSIDVNGDMNSSTFSINRQIAGGIEFVSASVGAGLSVQSGDVISGAGGSAGAGANVTFKVEDNYRFNNENYGDWDAVAQFILLADGNFNFLDNTLIRLLTVCQDVFTSQSTLEAAYIGDSKGVGIKAEAEASAEIGITPTLPLVSLNAHANVGVEGNIQYDFCHNNEIDRTTHSLEINGELNSSGGAGIKFNMPFNDEWAKDMPDLYTIFNIEEKVGLRVELVRISGTLVVEKINLYMLRRSVTNEDGFEVERCYTFTGNDAIQVIIYINSLMQNLQTAIIDNANLVVDNTTFQELVKGIFSEMYELQSSEQWNADISYSVLRKEFENISSFPFRFFMGAELLVDLSVEFGNEEGFEEGKYRVVEHGKWIKGKHYPLETFTDEIPNISTGFDDKMQEITNEIPIGIRTLIGIVNIITHSTIKNPNDTIYIGDNGSFLTLPEGAFPQSTDTIHSSSWSWYGNTPSSKINSIQATKRSLFQSNRNIAEAAYGMHYGIGGFYQFEPYDTLFSDTAFFNIAYDVDEIIGIDEQSLAMYYEDKINKKWIFIGGMVDTINHIVTAPISHLSLFTLAPAMPYGEFSLIAVPDSIYADSLSVSTILSDTIFRNNHTPVKDGAYFTVMTTHGSIISADADNTKEGVQVQAANGKIEFQIRSCNIAGVTQINVFSDEGSAFGSTSVVYYDTIPPSPPSIIDAVPGYKSVNLRWNANTEIDLAGYRIYYDTDTTAPYTGIHTVYGQPSPIVLGMDTLRNIVGLFNDSTYYFVLSAYDVSGNESNLSSPVFAKPRQYRKLKINLFLEGLFNPGLNAMNKASNETGPAFPDSTADVIHIELHDAFNTDSIVSQTSVYLSVNGAAEIEIPTGLNGNFYIVVKHRNSIETWSAQPIVFATDTITYDFTDEIAKAYGNNLNLIGSKYTIYGGDVNQDGAVDTADMTPVDNDSALYVSGYLVTDITGDGVVDTADMTIIDNNSFGYVGVISP